MNGKILLLKKASTVFSAMLLSLIGFSAHAQSVKGIVSDSLGAMLPGVNVVVKGTAVGTTTDVNGNYAISLDQIPTERATLIFSFIGYQIQEVPVGNQTTINVTLSEEKTMLGEVVVTALGIKREQKALGYATQAIDGEMLTDSRSNNWSGALSGKVAGLSLVSSGSGPLNSTRIKLRGDNSLNTNNNAALIVLDGVPMNSGLVSSGVGNAYGAGSGNDVPIDFGNGIADINPDDIESITVLKGPSATALYGSRAGGGALIITTKSGAKQKGLGVTVNSNFSMSDVLRWPDRQYEYGQGTGRAFNTENELYYSYGASEDGASTGGTSSAFGPKFDGQLYYQYDPTVEGQSPERVLWRPYEDNVTGFWRTGTTFTNNIALAGGNENNSTRLSVTHSKNEWIMPNTGYERFNAALSINQKISDKIRINAKVNYTNKNSDNLPATGYNNQSIAYFMIFQNPSIDLEWYAPIWKEGKNQVDQIHPFSSFIDNPNLIAYEMTNSVNSNTVVGNISAVYQITPKLEVMLRSGISTGQEEREQQRPYSTANFQKGYYKQQMFSSFETNIDGLLTYTEKIGNRIELRASVGANNMHNKLRRMDASVDGLVIPGVYKLANGINNPLVSSTITEEVINSVYGLVNVSFDDKIFLDITGRNDWFSSLPLKSNSVFYPSVNTSFVLSELFRLPVQISFAKLRLSVAQAGHDTTPYRTKKYYGPSDFPGSGSVPTLLHNTELVPELSTNFEAGLEYMMFERRIGLDLTLYSNLTKNQIVEVPLDPTTGYTRAVLNSGEVQNQGIELIVNAKPIVKQNFTWSTMITWAKNVNEVLSLADGLEGGQDIGYGGNATIRATVGGTTGDIYGFGFVRSPDGQIVYNANGLPARPAQTQYIGNAYADWKGGLLNEFTYKNFKLSFLFDGQYGGIVYSQTHHKMSEQGKLAHTLKGREDGFIVGEGVVDNGDGTYSPNTQQVSLPDYYADYYRRANVESNSFDASFIKLREARIEFNMPKALLSKTPFQNVSMAIYGRDLAMFTDFPMYDPETSALNGNTLLPGIEMGQLPTPRTYGFNLTLGL